MPIALSSPPMVVGIRHTSSATSTGTEKTSAAHKAQTVSASHRPAERSASVPRAGSSARFRSASSGALLLRPARSSDPGIRRPFSIVTRMTMRSLSTRVPPVTALRSPPLSRMTGADSPVMAASSTLAMPSITSPSAGMTSPASQTTVSAFCKIGAGTFSSRPFAGGAPSFPCAPFAVWRLALFHGLPRPLRRNWRTAP